MIIRQLYLDHFGKFRNAEFDLDEGMNIIYGGNESGKTTIRSFVLFVLFGNDQAADGGAPGDTKPVYAPSGISCEGRIVFEYSGRKYLASRVSGPGRNGFSVSDMQSGIEMVGSKGSISDLVRGLTPAAMDNTISIPQVYDQSDAGEYSELSSRKEELDREIAAVRKKMDESSGADYAEREKAAALIQRNNDIARRYKEKKQQLKNMEKNSVPRVSRDISSAWERFEDLRAELDDTRFTQNELRSKADGGGFKALAFTLPIIAAAALLWFMGSSLGMSHMLRAVSSLGIVIFALLVFLLVLASGSGKKKRARKMDKKAAAIEQEMRKLMLQYGVSSRESFRQLSIRGVAPDNSSDVASLKRELDELKVRYNELQIPLKPYLEKYGSSVTLERREDPELKARLLDLQKQAAAISGQMEEIDAAGSYSADQSPLEPIPLVLDDFFASYDDGRLKRTLYWLANQTNFSQALILTCHHRESDTLKELGVSFRYSELN